MFEEAGVMVIFDDVDLLRDGEGDIRDELVVLHVFPVASLGFEVEFGNFCLRGVSGKLGDVVGDSVFVVEIFLRERAVVVFPPEDEAYAGIDDRLSFEHIGVILAGDVYIGEYLEVGEPALNRAGASFLFVEGGYFKLGDGFSLLEADFGDFRAVIGFYFKVAA